MSGNKSRLEVAGKILPQKVDLNNKYKALEAERQSMDGEGDNPSSTRDIARVGKANPLYSDHRQEEEKAGFSWG